MCLRCLWCSLRQCLSVNPLPTSKRSWEQEAFLWTPDTTQTIAKLNANPLESTLTNSLTSPVVTGKLVSLWLTPTQIVYWKWRGGGIFREVMWWPDKPQPAKVQQSQKQVPATTDTQSVQMALNYMRMSPGGFQIIHTRDSFINLCM